MTRGGGGGQIPPFLRDVICGRPLRSSGMNVIVVFVIHMYVTGRVIYIYIYICIYTYIWDSSRETGVSRFYI